MPPKQFFNKNRGGGGGDRGDRGGGGGDRGGDRNGGNQADRGGGQRAERVGDRAERVGDRAERVGDRAERGGDRAERVGDRAERGGGGDRKPFPPRREVREANEAETEPPFEFVRNAKTAKPPASEIVEKEFPAEFLKPESLRSSPLRSSPLRSSPLAKSPKPSSLRVSPLRPSSLRSQKQSSPFLPPPKLTTRELPRQSPQFARSPPVARSPRFARSPSPIEIKEDSSSEEEILLPPQSEPTKKPPIKTPLISLQFPDLQRPNIPTNPPARAERQNEFINESDLLPPRELVVNPTQFSEMSDVSVCVISVLQAIDISKSTSAKNAVTPEIRANAQALIRKLRTLLEQLPLLERASTVRPGSLTATASKTLRTNYETWITLLESALLSSAEQHPSRTKLIELINSQTFFSNPEKNQYEKLRNAALLTQFRKGNLGYSANFTRAPFEMELLVDLSQNDRLINTSLIASGVSSDFARAKPVIGGGAVGIPTAPTKSQPPNPLLSITGPLTSFTSTIPQPAGNVVIRSSGAVRSSQNYRAESWSALRAAWERGPSEANVESRRYYNASLRQWHFVPETRREKGWSADVNDFIMISENSLTGDGMTLPQFRYSFSGSHKILIVAHQFEQGMEIGKMFLRLNPVHTSSFSNQKLTPTEEANNLVRIYNFRCGTEAGGERDVLKTALRGIGSSPAAMFNPEVLEILANATCGFADVSVPSPQRNNVAEIVNLTISSIANGRQLLNSVLEAFSGIYTEMMVRLKWFSEERVSESSDESGKSLQDPRSSSKDEEWKSFQDPRSSSKDEEWKEWILLLTSFGWTAPRILVPLSWGGGLPDAPPSFSDSLGIRLSALSTALHTPDTTYLGRLQKDEKLLYATTAVAVKTAVLATAMRELALFGRLPTANTSEWVSGKMVSVLKNFEKCQLNSAEEIRGYFSSIPNAREQTVNFTKDVRKFFRDDYLISRGQVTDLELPPSEERPRLAFSGLNRELAFVVRRGDLKEFSSDTQLLSQEAPTRFDFEKLAQWSLYGLRSMSLISNETVWVMSLSRAAVLYLAFVIGAARAEDTLISRADRLSVVRAAEFRIKKAIVTGITRQIQQRINAISTGGMATGSRPGPGGQVDVIDCSAIPGFPTINNASPFAKLASEFDKITLLDILNSGTRSDPNTFHYLENLANLQDRLIYGMPEFTEKKPVLPNVSTKQQEPLSQKKEEAQKKEFQNRLNEYEKSRALNNSLNMPFFSVSVTALDLVEKVDSGLYLNPLRRPVQMKL